MFEPSLALQDADLPVPARPRLLAAAVPVPPLLRLADVLRPRRLFPRRPEDLRGRRLLRRPRRPLRQAALRRQLGRWETQIRGECDSQSWRTSFYNIKRSFWFRRGKICPITLHYITLHYMPSSIPFFSRPGNLVPGFL